MMPAQMSTGNGDYKGSFMKLFKLWWRRVIIGSHPDQVMKWKFKLNRTQVDTELREKAEAEIRKTDPAFRDGTSGGDGIAGYEIWSEEVGYNEYDQDKGIGKFRHLSYTGRYWCGTVPPPTQDDFSKKSDSVDSVTHEKGKFITEEEFRSLMKKFKRFYGHTPF